MVCLGTFMGELIANAILGEEIFNPLDSLNKPIVPFYAGEPWLVNLGKNPCIASYIRPDKARLCQKPRTTRCRLNKVYSYYRDLGW